MLRTLLSDNGVLGTSVLVNAVLVLRHLSGNEVFVPLGFRVQGSGFRV